MPPKTNKITETPADEAQSVPAETNPTATDGPAGTGDPEVQSIKSETTSSEQFALVTARVLAAITIGETRYRPDDIIVELPEALANSHASALDLHPAAIELARTNGGKTRQYKG